MCSLPGTTGLSDKKKRASEVVNSLAPSSSDHRAWHVWWEWRGGGVFTPRTSVCYGPLYRYGGHRDAWRVVVPGGGQRGTVNSVVMRSEGDGGQRSTGSDSGATYDTPVESGRNPGEWLELALIRDWKNSAVVCLRIEWSATEWRPGKPQKPSSYPLSPPPPLRTILPKSFWEITRIAG